MRVMPAKQKQRVKAALARLSLERWTGSIAKWCEDNVRFEEPKLSGPFSFAGREYMREPLETWGNDNQTDVVLCWGTRTGKTRIIFGGLAWRIAHSPTRALWTMPNTHGTGGAQNVSRTRFQPMIRASASLAQFIPSGAHRHDFKSLQMQINGSILDLTGVNSPANLAGNPCDSVIQDEVDKYTRRGESEADPAKLADNRCKEFANPKRFKTSTPTLISGLIWQELQKTDLRRRFVPCPHCGKFVTLIWSQQFSVLENKDVPCAVVKWDDEARRSDGTWDLDRVVSSTRMVCPHCSGHIRDEHKVAIDARGEWRPTKAGSPGHVGFHLASLYSVSKETGFGQMAMRFLLSKRSLQGLQDFINSDLAEPYVGQELSVQRTEIIAERVEVGAEWVKLLTVDCQQKAPYFWYAVRAWSENKCHGLAAGSAENWDDIEKLQASNGIRNEGVLVDSGFGARDDAEVYRVCAEHGEVLDPVQDQLAECIGWMPAKGMAGGKRWKDPETGTYVPYFYRSIDPYLGTSEAGRMRLQLFEFAADYFKDVLTTMRKGGAFEWSVAKDVADEVYWRHMDGQVKTERYNKLNGMTENKWTKRHRYWPDHLFACEYMQVAFAVALGIVNVEGVKK